MPVALLFLSYFVRTWDISSVGSSVASSWKRDLLLREGGGDHWAISNAEISIVSRIQHTKIYSNKY